MLSITRLAGALMWLLAGTTQAQQNILLIVADDMGVEMLKSYGVGQDYAATPTLNRLAEEGLQFQNCWANPVCSPTRATILTGRYSFRTGVGTALNGKQLPLPLAELALPQLIKHKSSKSYRVGAFGKWHLADIQNGGSNHPNTVGFDTYVGSIYGMYQPRQYSGPGAYFEWYKTKNGALSLCTNYNTTDTVDEALHWIRNFKGPWIAYVPFSAPHEPFHHPPAHLLKPNGQVQPGLPFEATQRQMYKEMITAMDTEIGRLLDGLGSDLANTTVIFVSDNGTPKQVVSAPYTKFQAKGTVFQGGVHVPLLVWGKGVKCRPGSTSDAKVHTVDLFATIAEMASVDMTTYPANIPYDSISMVPYFSNPGKQSLRRFQFAETFTPNGNCPFSTIRGIANDQFKLIRRTIFGFGTIDSLYDLKNDPYEKTNLLFPGPLSPHESAAFVELDLALRTLLDGK